MLSAPAIIPCTSVITLRPGSAAPGTARVKPHRLVHRLLDPEPLGEGRRDQQPGVADQPLLVELDPHRIQTRRPGRNVRTVMHHTGDLLTGPQPPHTTATKALLRRTFKTQRPDGTGRVTRSIQA